jgi:glycerate kinase
VITGEGRLDAQTLHGKAPAGVADAANAAGVPVVVVSGARDLSDELLHGAGFAASYVLADLEPDLKTRMAQQVPLLAQVGRQVAEERLATDR